MRDFDLAVPATDVAVAGQSVLKAALMNALSPGPYLFWGFVTGPICCQRGVPHPGTPLDFCLVSIVRW